MAGIGNLKPIKLLLYGNTIDANGDSNETIQTTYKMWAEVSDNGGSKSQSNGRTEISDIKQFKVNFRGYLINGNYKVVYFGQTYALTNIQRIDEKRFNYQLTGFNIFESSTSQGGGGGGGGTFPMYTFSQGVPTTASGTFSRFSSNGSNFQILIDKPFKIKWPNTQPLQYPSANLFTTIYDFGGMGGMIDIDIYFGANTTFLSFLNNGSTNMVAPNNLPSTLLSLSIFGGLSGSFTLPPSLTYLDVGFNKLDQTMAVDIMQQLIDNNVNNGTLKIKNQTTGYLNLSMLTEYIELENRGWSIS